ncbi:glycosyltransferase involved in cell wall biosynthesis [Rhodanobacter sp. ANJX3]|uniref:glycosyltransferase n=1 Tax=Rhodanobacter sp. ANJX3 TaxID=2723083 RepID=UPI00161FD0E4|nr:glycosyltransferase [Rhodanobacter sp. ANJX3]MBB5360605.1 glycosyltransferase involved in cell wall biosynthesis [Rhodanobacter sp. ANJX3]
MPHRIIFIHQNAPGQFKHLLAYCAANSQCEVVVIGEKQRLKANFPKALPNVQFHVYEITEISREQVPVELWTTTQSMRRGRAVALCLQNVRDSGFRPDVIYGHPGWGEMLHVKDVFPDARIVNYCEFYFNREGQDLSFDPEFQLEAVDSYRVRTDNMAQLVSLIDADASICPTHWQRSRYPTLLRDRMTVVHDGVDPTVVKPDPSATVRLSDGLVLDRSRPVITYVSRNLEPYRGFHVFMRALPEILRRLPTAHVLIVGGDDVSYGRQLAGGMSYRELMLKQLGAQIEAQRVHFLGRIPYAQYLRVLQVSRVHVYLTYPFVLSWSVLDAMATGAVVIGSDTAPVREVIDDQVNGLLVDFFSHAALAEKVCQASLKFDQFLELRERSVATIRDNFNLASCISRQLDVLFPSSDLLRQQLATA